MMADAASRCVAIFGGSRCLPGDPDWNTARHLGRHIAEHGWSLVCGGYGGVMEAASQGVADRGGRAIGVLLEAYGPEGNPHLTEKIVTADLYARIQTIIASADAYVVLPGSTGTLVELALVWELLNKGLVRGRPLICLGEYWRPVVDHLARQPLRDPRLPSREGPQFAGAQVTFCDEPEDVVHFLHRAWD